MCLGTRRRARSYTTMLSKKLMPFVVRQNSETLFASVSF
jgi:hypothetical protein